MKAVSKEESRELSFEGSEKKLELVVSAAVGDLRQKSEAFWQKVVRSADAKILSKLSSDACDAFLLSESSLFVFKDSLTMITCGRTRLAKAAVELVKEFGRDKVLNLIYERKNEYYPHLQKTHFAKDLDLLKGVSGGKAMRLGQAGEHHVYVFHTEGDFRPPENDVTSEILTYHLQGEAARIFTSSGLTREGIRDYLRLGKWFPGFQFDDFIFSPFGYSLNGLKDGQYMTIHVTPQESGSYVSFEMNWDMKERWESFVRDWVSRFQPLSFDVIQFRPDALPARMGIPKYRQVQDVQEPLSCGYQMQFATYYASDLSTDRATMIESLS